jgi:hypothetical protein
LTATLIGVINGKLELTTQEKNVVVYLENLSNYRQYRATAASKIAIFWKIRNRIESNKKFISPWKKFLLLKKYENASC